MKKNMWLATAFLAISFVSQAFAQNTGNVVYVNGQAQQGQGCPEGQGVNPCWNPFNGLPFCTSLKQVNCYQKKSCNANCPA